MAYRMVTEFGFSRNIGPFSYAGLPERERQLADHPEGHRRGARTSSRSSRANAPRCCSRTRAALDRLTAELLEHETVSGDVVDDCLKANSIQVAA